MIALGPKRFWGHKKWFDSSFRLGHWFKVIYQGKMLMNSQLLTLAYDMFLKEILDGPASDGDMGLHFHPLNEIIDCYQKKFITLNCSKKWSQNIHFSLFKWPWGGNQDHLYHADMMSNYVMLASKASPNKILRISYYCWPKILKKQHLARQCSRVIMIAA